MVSKNTPFSSKSHLILLMSAYFCKKISIFYKKYYLYSKHYYESCVRDSLDLFSVFVRQKVTVNQNVSFTDYTSGHQLLNCFKLAINLKNDNDVTNSDITPSSDFFDIAVFFFIKFSYWSKFHVSIISILEFWQFSSIKG